MRTTRLFYPDILSCGKNIRLNVEASNHLIKVLRTKIASSVVLFNGDGYNYSCKTLDNHAKKTGISVDSKIKNNSESNLDISLIQGLSRHDRMDTTIQKSVELGVNSITPIICQRSNVKFNTDKIEKKASHWRKVIVSACEQSGRSTLPQLKEIFNLEKIVSTLKADSLKIILDPAAKTSLSHFSLEKLQQHDNKVEVLIGPEGGLHNDEIDFLKKKGFININFGPRILRTETAGPAIICALQLLWGDLT